MWCAITMGHRQWSLSSGRYRVAEDEDTFKIVERNGEVRGRLFTPRSEVDPDTIGKSVRNLGVVPGGEVEMSHVPYNSPPSGAGYGRALVSPPHAYGQPQPPQPVVMPVQEVRGREYFLQEMQMAKMKAEQEQQHASI
jgi:hypothetical protein